jgi:hypothetical protein
MMTSHIHYPEFVAVTDRDGNIRLPFSPDEVAKLTGKKLEKALAHIEKMQGIRDQISARLKAVTEAEERGECYCDDEYTCGTHARMCRELYPGRSVRLAEYQRRMNSLRAAK